MGFDLEIMCGYCWETYGFFFYDLFYEMKRKVSAELIDLFLISTGATPFHSLYLKMVFV